MSLITVQRSPSLGLSSDFPSSGPNANDENDSTRFTNKSLSECYFASKATAYVLSPHEQKPHGRNRCCNLNGNDIQKHLQSMFYLLREEDTLKMAVKLESVHAGRTRYLVVVSCSGKGNTEESCLLGIDCNEKITIGLVLKVLADTSITLDGDGGFSVSICGRQHIFKPVSVQAMWSALQTLHKVSAKAREYNYFESSFSHDWVQYYEHKINSDRSCLNEWHAMDNLESKRPPSPDSVRIKPGKRDETESVIKSTLKDIMMSVDIDEVTSKYIRTRLEEELDMDLGEYKPFIDQEMLTILGQMDSPTQIFDHVFLGSEWNASNLEELQKNRIGHILNVTREIDNFFPGMFDYMNIRVLDDDKTDLLKYWDKTYKYITKAKKDGLRVLVHCKMGISRSASVVIAYAMKSYKWDLKRALKYVKHKRNCIKPNQNFIAQLETYQGILDAMKNKEKLQRSKSENNLNTNRSDSDNNENQVTLRATCNRYAKSDSGLRSKSWSPDQISSYQQPANTISPPVFLSLENLTPSPNELLVTTPKTMTNTNKAARHVLMPCSNGNIYSVSPNQIVHLPNNNRTNNNQYKDNDNDEIIESSSQTQKLVLEKVHKEKKGLVLNLTNQFEISCSKPNSPVLHKKSDTCLVQNCEHDDLLQHVTPKASSLHNISSKSLRILRKKADLFSNNVVKHDEQLHHNDNNEQQLKEQQHHDSNDSSRGSWSSFDSSVNISFGDEKQIRQMPSRHSSWGSYDTRSHNAVIGADHGAFRCSFSGSVRRTKAKLEEKTVTDLDRNLDSKSPLSSTSSQSSTTNETDIVTNLNSRLSVSAPERHNLITLPYRNQRHKLRTAKSCNDSSLLTAIVPQCDSDKHRNQYRKSFSMTETLTATPPITICPENCSSCTTSSHFGIVQNLKKEFEAKTTINPNNNNNNNNLQKVKIEFLDVPEDALPNNVVLLRNKKSPNSAPSSPISANNNRDDISVKNLVGKYEDVTQIDDKTRKRSGLENRSFMRPSSSNLMRHSCFEIPSTIHERRPVSSFVPAKRDAIVDKKRPPVAPVVTKGSFVMTTVFNKVTKRQQQQHGKSHPLSRLIVKPKQVSSPVYNTM